MTAVPCALPAFAGYGIELEYMIVDSGSLAIRPIADRVLAALPGSTTRDPAAIGWSNELVRHVVEVKNLAPVADLAPLGARFHEEIRAANRLLARHDARLMPTAMHPWMDPRTETALSDDAIYRAYDRVYGCDGHGWSNLQSMHVNLPFSGDAQFARLHAAIRLVLPLLPALAASSPIADGAPTGLLDFRLDACRGICAITPGVAGAVVPETVETRAEYEAKILAPMYDEIAPHDPDRLLRHEWLNSRGAIARFDRSAIEIRVVDVQECPHADMAIAAAASAVVKALYDEHYAPLDEQQAISTELLHDVLLATIRNADEAIVHHPEYLHALGMPRASCTARDIWSALLEDTGNGAWWRPAIDVILREGPLGRRILRAVNDNADRDRLHAVYDALCRCLDDGRMFR
jgi:glutamate---cysteine ligase / carboxylate-amine ligase